MVNVSTTSHLLLSSICDRVLYRYCIPSSVTTWIQKRLLYVGLSLINRLLNKKIGIPKKKIPKKNTLLLGWLPLPCMIYRKPKVI